MKYALVNPPWTFEGSTYFGCRDPHCLRAARSIRFDRRRIARSYGPPGARLKARGYRTKKNRPAPPRRSRRLRPCAMSVRSLIRQRGTKPDCL